MSFLRLLPALAASSIALAFAPPSQAFCLTHTCDPKKEVCTFVDGCNVSGKVLYWASSQVSWDVQRDNSQKAGISSATLDTLVENAFQRWENATCNDGGRPSIELVNRGPISCGKAEYNQAQPNANVITFHDAAWPYGAESTIETLALTTVFFNGETGEIYDANVEINTDQASFALIEAEYPAVDLNAVLTHELGHFLGLSHSQHSDATMYSSYQSGMTTLEQDDIDGICATLAPNRVASSNSSEPRHGFSGECCTGNCNSVQSGCCSSTIGGHVPASQTLGLWAFGLGLCVWGARNRFRRLVTALRQ